MRSGASSIFSLTFCGLFWKGTNVKNIVKWVTDHPPTWSDLLPGGCETPGALYVFLFSAHAIEQIWSLSIKLDLGFVWSGVSKDSRPLMCDLRCRGQMYVSQHSLFPQRWDRFVKRLMCLNPVKDLGWVRAAAPTSGGRKFARIFPELSSSSGSADSEHMWFLCVKHVCSQRLKVMDLLTCSSMPPLPHEGEPLSHSQCIFTGNSRCPIKVTVPNLTKNKTQIKV